MLAVMPSRLHDYGDFSLSMALATSAIVTGRKLNAEEAQLWRNSSKFDVADGFPQLFWDVSVPIWYEQTLIKTTRDCCLAFQGQTIL